LLGFSFLGRIDGCSQKSSIDIRFGFFRVNIFICATTWHKVLCQIYERTRPKEATVEKEKEISISPTPAVHALAEVGPTREQLTPELHGLLHSMNSPATKRLFC
jgi:hypothetical protein